VGALTSRVVRTARGPVEVAVTGSGPALLIVHGMPGDWRQSRVLAAELADEATVVLVTRPGYGRTPLRSGRSPVEQAALYAALLTSLNIEKAVVLGISGGGPSAFAFAALHPEQCAGLVLACPVRSGVIVAPSGMRRLAAVPGLWSFLATLTRAVAAVRRPAPSTEGLTAAELALLEDPYVREAADDFEAERVSTIRGRGLRNDTLHLNDPAPTWNTDVPVVVMHGDLDDVVPLANAQAYAEAVPAARLEVLPGLGHAVPVFARAAVVAELRALLSDHGVRRGAGRKGP
jgi:pimeloyl-ACP methyl ester carboxylesterase